MLRPIRIAAALLILAVTMAPRPTLAWSERPVPTNPDGSAMFNDPDENVERMAGRSGDGESQRSGGFTTSQGGNWSFSVTPQSSTSSSPFNSPFNSGFGSSGFGSGGMGRRGGN